MTTSETSRYVRLRVELVIEVDDSGALTGAALERIAADEFMPDDERTHAQSAVREEEAEALAYLVDPFDLVSEVPGIELAQASWSCEQIDYDPDSADWELDMDEDEIDGYEAGPDGYPVLEDGRGAEGEGDDDTGRWP
ncbi:hypothetical protein ACH46N_27480 [Streptomyces pristinaespiralis]|jgi:hypothetical protein|nr:hypothetical protein [Streptomyces pristinaespiralis]ALC21247.1 hypothetical protein SPRI_2941 [Streptomyces pristinaespiralis]QMU16006.1 hypothetical protein H3L99_22315 [Streptomyces pristinaespiralis]